MTYDVGQQHCVNKGMDLCLYMDICPQGMGHPPFNGTLTGGNHWVPIK